MFTKATKKFYYWHFFIALVVIKYAFFCYLEYRQYRYLSDARIPSDMKPFFTQTEYDRIRTVEMNGLKLSFWESFAHCVNYLISFAFGLLPLAWNKFSAFSCTNSKVKRLLGDRRVFLRSLLFYSLYALFAGLVQRTILIYPRILWEGEADTNTSGSRIPSILGIWSEKRKSYMLAFNYWHCQIGFMILAYFSNYLGHFVYLAIAILASANSFVESYLVPFLVGNTLPPPNPSHLAPLLPILRRVGFPTNRILFRPEYNNAGAGGIGRHAVIIIGLGLQNMGLSLDEIVAVMGHELGHWYYYHRVFFGIGKAVAVFILFSLGIIVIKRSSLYKSFGIQADKNELPYGVGLIILIGFYNLISFFLAPLKNYLSNICEYQADEFAVKLGLGNSLLSSMAKTHPFGFKLADPLFGVFKYDHPVFSNRIAAISKALRTATALNS